MAQRVRGPKGLTRPKGPKIEKETQTKKTKLTAARGGSPENAVEKGDRSRRKSGLRRERPECEMHARAWGTMSLPATAQLEQNKPP